MLQRGTVLNTHFPVVNITGLQGRVVLSSILAGSVFLAQPSAVVGEEPSEVLKMFSDSSVHETTYNAGKNSKAAMRERYKARAMELNEQGLRLFFKGDAKAGAAKLKQALGHDPDNETILYNLSGIFLSQRDPKSAAGMMLRAIRNKPEDLSFHTRLAEAYLMDGMLEKAIDSYTRVVEVDPLFNRAIVKLGTLYAMTERLDEAETTLNKALRLIGDDPDILSGLGSTLVMQKKFAEAIPVLERAQQLDASSDNEVALGLAYESIKEESKALQCYRRAVALGDKDTELLHRIKEMEVKE